MDLHIWLCVYILSHVWFFATSWAIDCQNPLLMKYPGKNTRVACHFLLQGIFRTGIKSTFLALAGRFFTTAPPRKPLYMTTLTYIYYVYAKVISST